MSNVGIDNPDIPGIAENNTPGVNPYMAYLESYEYVPSKPYPVPAFVGQTTRKFWQWNGYRNFFVRPYDMSDPFAYIAPKTPISPNVYNAQAPRPGLNQGFVGAAPVKGIFTGVVDDNTTCH